MQSASVNYVQASSGAGGTWAEPRLRVDWMRDGYDTTPNMLDMFRRNLTDQWGTTDTGQTWTLPVGAAADFDVSYDGTDTLTGAYGSNATTGASGFYYTHHAVLSGPLVYVTTQTVWLSLPVPQGDAIEAGMMFMRYTDASNHYRAGAVVGAGGTVRLAVVRATTADGESVLVDTSTGVGVTYAGGSQVLVVRGRMLADGTIQLKAWIDGTAPPTTWQVEVTDPDQITTSGVAGLRTVVYPGTTNTRPIVVKYHRYEVTNGLPDDISTQLGGWTAEHHIDDGYPDSVTFISGTAIADLDADLGAPPAHLTDTPMRVAEYYSPYNTDSPLYGRDRDVAPVALDHGLITASGPERIRVFTGQMLDIPVKGGSAKLSATSAARLAMRALVQPPAFAWFEVGLNGSWPVSWALAQCGLYVSPPPRDSCRWWTPMHGSTRPFIPSRNVQLDSDATFWLARRWTTGINALSNARWRPEWIDGPYLTAPNCALAADETRYVAQRAVEFGDGDDMFSTAGNRGRLEFWIRGDTTSNVTPAGSGTPTRFAGLRMPASLATDPGFFMGVNTSRQVFVSVNDGAGHSATLTSDDTLPTDGAWYFVGAAYDIAAQRLWVTNFAGTTKSTTAGTLTTASLPAVDTFSNNFPSWENWLPAAEIQFCTGSEANVDSNPTWVNAITFDPDVIMTKSQLELTALIEKEPVEAWEFVSRFAQGELAALRTDELDRITYLNAAWWVQDAQQQVTDLLSTEINAESPDVNIDPTKIRNTVQVTYSTLEVPATRMPAYRLTQQLTISPGTTIVEFPFQSPVVALSDAAILFLDDTDLAGGVEQFNAFDFVSLNSSTDGTGTYADSSTVTITKGEWSAGSTIWTFYNASATTWYTANASNLPTLQVSGYPVVSTRVAVSDSNDLSVSQRGERSLPVQGTEAVQTDVDARRLARDLKMGLRQPTPIVEAFQVFGEARRQPGDLVEVADPSLTRISGQWRLQSVTHKFSGGSYTQQVRIRPTLPICVVGEGIIGQSLVGPEE